METLYTQKSKIQFAAGEEIVPAVVMRSERMVPQWIADMKLYLGDANLKQVALPMNRKGWAVPTRFADEAKAIAEKHFNQILVERQGMLFTEEEDVEKAPEEGRVLAAIEGALIGIQGRTNGFGEAEYKLTVDPNTDDELIHLIVDRSIADACTPHLFKEVVLKVELK